MPSERWNPDHMRDAPEYADALRDAGLPVVSCAQQTRPPYHVRTQWSRKLSYKEKERAQSIRNIVKAGFVPAPTETDVEATPQVARALMELGLIDGQEAAELTQNPAPRPKPTAPPASSPEPDTPPSLLGGWEDAPEYTEALIADGLPAVSTRRKIDDPDRLRTRWSRPLTRPEESRAAYIRKKIKLGLPVRHQYETTPRPAPKSKPAPRLVPKPPPPPKWRDAPAFTAAFIDAGLPAVSTEQTELPPYRVRTEWSRELTGKEHALAASVREHVRELTGTEISQRKPPPQPRPEPALLPAIRLHDEYPAENIEQLAAAIIERAVLDAFAGNRSEQRECENARRWLTAESGDDAYWRTRWCEVAGIDPDLLFEWSTEAVAKDKLLTKSRNIRK